MTKYTERFTFYSNTFFSSKVDTDKMNLEILLSAIIAKDKNAFNALYDKTIDRVYSLAYKITYSIDLADEVISDVYLQVWQQAEQFDSNKGGVVGWIMLICRCRALDLLRKHKRISDKTEEYVDQNDNRNSECPDILEAIDNKSTIYAALSKLSFQQQQLLSLAYFKGYSHNELVNITGLSLGTVKTNLRRSLILMRNNWCRSKFNSETIVYYQKQLASPEKTDPPPVVLQDVITFARQYQQAG